MTAPIRPDTGRIERNIAAMRAQGASEQDIESYLTEHEHLTPAGKDFGDVSGGTSTAASQPSERLSTGIAAPSNAFARGLEEVPFLTKAAAGADALASASVARAHGQPFFKTLGKDYEQDYNARETAIDRYRHEHPKMSTAAAVAGNVLPALLTMGGSLGEQAGVKGAEKVAEKAPLLTRMAQGAKAGAGFGSLQGASHAHGDVGDYAREIGAGAAAGAVGGALLTPPTEYLAGKLAQGVGKVAGAAGKYLPEGSRFSDLIYRVSGATGAKGRAAERLGTADLQDKAAGFIPADEVPGVPMLAVNRAGPAVQGAAEGIAQRPGAGRSILTSRLTAQVEQKRPSLERAFDAGTGTTGQQGEALLQRLADEHSRLDRVAQIADEVRAADQASGKVKAPAPNALAAWRQEMGGSLANGIQRLKQAVSEKNATAAEMFGRARAETAGQAMQSPTLDVLRETPVGQMAETWARVQKANRGRGLPVVSEPDQASVQKLVDAGVPMTKAIQFGGTVEKEALDPETVHYMTQFLAKAARLGVHDGQGGKLATQAQGALNVWGQARNELPPVFRQAMDATAAKFRVIDAVNMGRDLIRTQLNPAGNKALHTSLDAVEQRLAAMAPDEQHAARVGMQSAITDYFRTNNKSPNTLVMQLREPTSALSRKVALATGDAQAPQRLADRLLAQQTAVHTVTPPSPNMPAELHAAGKGLDVLKHGVSAPSNAPQRSLAVLERDLASLTPAERDAFREAAAQAVRGEAAGSSLKSAGKVFGGEANPERARQVALAFPSGDAANTFQSQVAAWDKIAAQRDQILRGSQTSFRDAVRAGDTGDEGGRVAKSLMHGNFGQAASQIMSTGSRAAATRSLQQEDEIIARWLTSPDAKALPDAVRATLLRRFARDATRRALPRVFGNAAGSGATQ